MEEEEPLFEEMADLAAARHSNGVLMGLQLIGFYRRGHSLAIRD